MIRHGEHSIITAPKPTTPETTVSWYVDKARTHPAAKRAAFRRRVWRDHRALGDRLEVAAAARALASATDASLTAALADLRDGVTP